ncbi:MAG: single-stranded DNA-binding protein [Chloroflexi bacterium]|nr:single-stranded DNA-binding protein [Chloroflexota bacterium]
MPYSLNRVELIGRLGQDPNMRFTTAGQAVTRISLATDRPSRSGAETGTDWHQIVCWDKLAEFAGQHLAKGRLVFVAGRLSYRTWEGRDGQTRRAAEVTATEIILLDRRPSPDSSGSQDEIDTTPAASPEGDEPEDDVPF